MNINESVLLVEGITDEYFIREFCRKKKLDCNFTIDLCNGINRLKAKFKTYLLSNSAYQKIWVMVDADNDAKAVWQSLRDILISSNKYSDSINTKSSLPTDGIVNPDNNESITVGVWIMPNNLDSGMLEDFIIKLINDNDTLIAEVNDAIESLETRRNEHSNIFKEVHSAKAKIGTWLSWQERPGIPLHIAIERKLISLDGELSQQFSTWLVQLINKK